MNKITLKNLIIIVVIVGVLIIPGLVVYLMQGKSGEKGLTSEEVGEKVVKYINENFLQGQPQISLISIEKENELYKLKVKSEAEEGDVYATQDGKFLFFQPPLDLEKKLPGAEEQGTGGEESLTIGSFSISKDAICKENGKPVVYFFGSKTCPHCAWEHPVMEEVAAKFEGEIVFHNNMDSDKDSDVFQKYSTGGIPTLVLGCKYYRVGSGEQSGEENESKALTALICKLTENKPNEVCSSVQDLINQVQ